MSTLSKIFDRFQTKSSDDEFDEASLDAAAEAPTDQPPSETWADLGTRVGGDNESLRNLLIDVGRRLEGGLGKLGHGGMR